MDEQGLEHELSAERNLRVEAEGKVMNLQHRFSMLKQELKDVRKELKVARQKPTSSSLSLTSPSPPSAVVEGVVGVVGATASLGLGLLGLEGAAAASPPGLEGADAAGGDLDLGPLDEPRTLVTTEQMTGSDEENLDATEDIEAMLRENEEVHMRVFQMRRDAQLARESSLSKLAALEEQLGELSATSSATVGKMTGLSRVVAFSEAKVQQLRKQMQEAREEDSLKLRLVKERNSNDLRALRERSEGRAKVC